MIDQKNMQATVVAQSKQDINQRSMRLALFNEDGSPYSAGGGGEKAFSGWSAQTTIPNSGNDIVLPLDALVDLDQGDVLNDTPAGAYVTKLRAMWAVGATVSTGAAQMVLIHIADDDSETVLASYIVSPEYPTMGDDLLSDVHYGTEKIDMGVAPAHGRLELRVMQSTDQTNIDLTAQVHIGKL